MKLYVGNLPFRLDSEDVRRMFEEFGEIESAEVVFDYDTGRSRGFAFVKMASESQAEQAASALNGKKIAGREIKVREAAPPKVKRLPHAGWEPESSRADINWYGGKSW